MTGDAMALLSFTKNVKQQNILFDEYFSEYCKIDILAFNYDGSGAALCLCDGTLQHIERRAVRKILFGASKESVENYLHGIFDPDAPSDHINRTGGDLLFRLPELNKLKKYDILNLAKKTFKTFQETKEDHFFYFCPSTATLQSKQDTACSMALYGNTKSRVVHRTNCKSFNAITCTSLFNSLSEATSAGFKPCRMCKP